MCATCESAEGARSHRRIEVRRATDKRELIQALVLTVGAIGRGYLRNKSRQSAPNGIPDQAPLPRPHLSHTHLLDVADGQLELLARMTLEHITSTWTLALRATGCRFANARNRDKDLFEYPL